MAAPKSATAGGGQKTDAEMIARPPPGALTVVSGAEGHIVPSIAQWSRIGNPLPPRGQERGRREASTGELLRNQQGARVARRPVKGA